ncbi:LysR family transcriptional regulator [Serratia liquefaciens]|uniref:LysR family transcriptional regulator n=1 Tax=Serratia liquefaciens TaxID=614 RepID=UPI00101F4169|nr:LysR family transcriptional regulator [Serratia liquefaciens]MBH2810547.1 LysR family transcriptional regulator [Serratia liquefaciens]RYM73628.1 LysR family transcriptional regulator [Serratia liquefaciens]
MDFNATKMFVSVVQAGSLSAAADKTHVPLPTLSRRIRELERELDVQLLERSPRGIKLTEAGSRLYEHASRGVEALNEAQQAVMNDETRLKGRLRLSMPPNFDPWWDLLGAFQQRFPEISVSVFSTERRIDLVQDGIDVSLRVGTIVHESMVARQMLKYRHLLVAAPSLLTQFGQPASVEDLHHYPCASWAADSSARGLWRLGHQVFEPKAVLVANDYALLRSRAVAGQAVTELPPFMANKEIAAGRLCAVLPSYPLPEQTLSLLYPSQRHPSRLVRAYLDFCQEQLTTYLSANVE